MREFIRLKSLTRRKVALITLASLITLSVAAYLWLFVDLPPINQLDAGLTLPSTRIYDRQGRLLYEILANSQTGGRNTAITLQDIPDHCENAIISIEDANFYAHPGVDLVGVVRAAWINVQGGEVLAGGSTITQQVARNLLLTTDERNERSIRRKLREMILAVQLQNAYSKADVLALYLNQSYFGNLAYGIEAAARAYFGKSAVDLSLSECALLAGLVQSPAVYDPLTNLEAAQARQTIVLNLMAREGYINATQAEQAQADTLQFASVPFPIEAPHFVMAVIKQLERQYPDGLTRDGLDVITTVDLDWQRAAQSIVQQQLYALNNPLDGRAIPANANNAALLALDPHTGQVLVMLGSPNYFDEANNGAVNATLALRQPGSTLKPFTYAAAFDPNSPSPMTAATMILDVRTPFVTRRLESYVPSNYGFVEHGPVLIREALASSLNIPVVVALERIGIERMVTLAANAGLTTLATNTQVDLSITLGGGEVRLIDLVQAYSIFPNEGRRVEPTMILEVRQRNGELLYQWQPPAQGVQVIDPRVAWLINDILSDDNARIAGFGRVSVLNIGRPAAAKTGTTTDFRDNWIVGYTPNLVVGVWVGNADNTPMVNITGVSGAAPIWNIFMRQVLQGQPALNFTRPDGLVRLEVCALSGLLVTENCPRTRREWFIEGTQPTEPDNLYQAFRIDNRTGLIAEEMTPPENQVRRVFAVLPQEAREWASRNGYPPLPQYANAQTLITMPDTQAGLRLLSPDPYTNFQISPLTPLETQRLRFSVGVPPETIRVTYRLNGDVIGTVEQAPWSLWWTLALGEHQLTAEAELRDGSRQTTAPIFFTVSAFEMP